jgi:hypothetical protein
MMYRIFIGGIMQGSRLENDLVSQDYRAQLTDLITRYVPDAEVVDPFSLHPGSVNYDDEKAKQTLLALAKDAGASDALIAYLPAASMGTALEMYEAFTHRTPVITISPMRANWVVRHLSSVILEDISDFEKFLLDGKLQAFMNHR